MTDAARMTCDLCVIGSGLLAPVMALAVMLMLWAVIPLAPTVIGSDISVGVLYIVAIGAFGTLGLIMAGWGSNNKYALLGALRTVAVAISYEIPMVVALLLPVLLARSMSLQDIVNGQSLWYILAAPLAALIFLISAIAELGRAPFDLAEAESEIVAGFHIEYTGMKFGLFYAGELLHAVTMGALFATFFLVAGGPGSRSGSGTGGTRWTRRRGREALALERKARTRGPG